MKRELFAGKAPKGCAPAYACLIHPRNATETAARVRCEAMWSLFEPLADPVFLERLPFEFHQRWFEMYMGATLIDAGLNPEAPTPGAGPDFQLMVEGRRIFIEAVCATAGDPLHADAVPEPVYRDAEGRLTAVNVPHDQISLRLAHSIRSKIRVFDRYRIQGLVTSDDACLIALNLREIPQAWADGKEHFFRAVYGVGNRFVVLDRRTLAVVDSGHEHREILIRAGGAAEAVAPLLDPAHSDISGIIGSSTDAFNQRGLFGDDLVLMPHASAQAPYPRGLLRRGVEISLTPGKGSWSITDTDHGAPEPQGPGSFTLQHEGAAVQVGWQITGGELHVQIGGRDTAVPVRKGEGNPADMATEIAHAMLAAARPSRRRENPLC